MFSSVVVVLASSRVLQTLHLIGFQVVLYRRKKEQNQKSTTSNQKNPFNDISEKEIPSDERIVSLVFTDATTKCEMYNEATNSLTKSKSIGCVVKTMKKMTIICGSDSRS